MKKTFFGLPIGICVIALLLGAPPALAQTIGAVAPNSAEQGQTLSVSVGLQGILAAPGAFLTFSGDGIEVSSTTVLNNAILIASVSIRRDATPGARDVTVGVTSPSGTLSVVSAAGAFTVVEKVASILAMNPSSAQQGTTIDVEIAGLNTNFGNGRIGPNVGSFVFFSGLGIEVGIVDVSSRGTLRASITIRGDAPVGARDVSVITGGTVTEVAQGRGIFTIVAPPTSRTTVGRVIGVFPTFLVQNTDSDIVIAGENTDFQRAISFPSFSGEGLTFNFNTQVNVVSPTSLVVSVHVDENAPPTLRDISVITGRDDGAEVVTARNAIRVIAPGSSLSISTSTSALRVEETLRASVTLANIGPEATVDVYIALQLPSGDMFFLAPDLNTFVPYLNPAVRNLHLPESLSPVNVDLSLNLSGVSQPAGLYTLFAGLVHPGTTEVIGEVSSSAFGVLNR